MFEDLPLFRTTVKILKFWSFILDNNWRRYLSLVSCGTLVVCQFVHVITMKQPFDAVVRDTYIVVIWYTAVMRTTTIIIKRYQYEKFMEELKDVYLEIEKNECLELKRLLARTSKSARSLAIWNMILGSSVSLGLLIYPIFSSSRVLPYGMYVPGVDKHQTPWYEVLFAIQAIITPMGNLMFIPFTNLITSFIMFGVLRCKVLQCHLRNLKSLSSKDVPREVRWCIRYQLDIRRHVKIVNSLTNFIFLIEFFLFGGLLCALMFLLITVSSRGGLVIICIYIVMTLSQILSVYWHADELTYESAEIAVAAYDTEWFNFDLKTEKSIMMMIALAQKPCGISVGNMYLMTLELFLALLNTAYSYFTLIRRVYG